jgi:rhodanese-related sulfurtransferase
VAKQRSKVRSKRVKTGAVSTACALHSKIVGWAQILAPLQTRKKVKFIIDNWMLLTVALTSGAFLLWPVIQTSGGGLTAEGAVQLINREKAVVIDVCEAGEFAAGHVGGSKNIPLNSLEEKLAGAVKNKGLPLILVCQTGARSARAVAIAKKLGYEQAQSMAGGLKAWRAANLPLEKA